MHIQACLNNFSRPSLYKQAIKHTMIFQSPVIDTSKFSESVFEI